MKVRQSPATGESPPNGLVRFPMDVRCRAKPDRAHTSFVVFVAVLIALVAVGAWGYAQQLIQGDVVTGMRTVGNGGAVWGLYIAMDGFFLGAGIAVMLTACLARIFGNGRLEAVARIAMPVAITCFLAASLSVMADQGRPFAALRALSYFARAQSPMFVTFTTVTAVCLFGSLVHCVLARRPDLAEYAKRASLLQPLQRLLAAGYRDSAAERYRRARSGFWMSFWMVPALLAPLFALAAMFTVRLARPVPSIAVEMLAFLLTSGAGGVGLVLIAGALVDTAVGQGTGLGRHARARLAAALLLIVTLAAAASIGSVATGLVFGEAAVAATARAMLSDAYAPLFWTCVVCFFVSAAVLLREGRRGFRRRRRIVAAAVLAELAALLHHYVQLVVWQTDGFSLPYVPGTYAPTAVEVLVTVGIVAFSLLALLPAVRLIPFAPIVSESLPVAAPATDWWRGAVTVMWALGGAGMSAMGLALSARVGVEPTADPAVTGSPLIFALGLSLLVTTGAVYELWPMRARSRA